MTFVLRPARSPKERITATEVARLEKLVADLSRRYGLTDSNWRANTRMSQTEKQAYSNATRLLLGVRRKYIEVVSGEQ